MNAMKKKNAPEVLNPTVSVPIAREMLGYRENKSVYVLARKGLIRPCIISPNGWRRWQPGENTDHRNRLFFIKSELEQYIEEKRKKEAELLAPDPPTNTYKYDQETIKQVLALAAPLLDDKCGVYLVHLTEPLKGSGIKKSVIRSILFEAGVKCYEYTPEQKEIVLREADLIKDDQGGVSRSALFEVLHTKHGMSNKSYSFYKKMKDILDDYNIPYIGNRRDTGKPLIVNQ